MQLYNPTNSSITVPFAGERIEVPSHGVSVNFLANPEFVTMIMSAFKPTEIAFIITGAAELTMMAGVLGSIEYSVQSLDEAIQKFNK